MAWEKIYDVSPERTDKFLEKYRQWYVLNVNVENPKKLHKKHKRQMEKLVQTSTEENTYEVQFKNLNEALRPGLKVHWVIRFEQSLLTTVFLKSCQKYVN